jgi:hypothetical protein
MPLMVVFACQNYRRLHQLQSSQRQENSKAVMLPLLQR